MNTKASKDLLNSATLFILAAPSGTGKTSLLNALLKEIDRICVSISYTTRPPRPKERNGVDYFFVDEAEFKRMIQANAFLEYASVFGYYYGTSRAWVENNLQSEQDIVLEIDWQGAKQVCAIFPQAVSIFILPPSKQALYQRLTGREQDKESIINKRITEASREMSHCYDFDYLLVNTVFEETLTNLCTIVRAQRLRQQKQIIKYHDLLEKLLKNSYN